MRQFIAVLMVFVAPAFVRAQPLTDRVPADALVYFGWRGTDALGATYQNSHLGAVVAASNFHALFDYTLPQLIGRIPQDQPELAAAAQALVPLARQVWKRPTVCFLASGSDARGHWEPWLGVICDAGEGAAEFHKTLADLVAQAGKTRIPLKTAIDGQFVIFTVGYEDPLLATRPKSALRDAAAFTTAMKQVDADPAYVAYVDFQRAVKAVDQGIAQGRDKAAAAKWPALRDSFGLSGLKRFVTTGAFDGKDWSSRTFIESPAPRGGMLTLLRDQPVRESTYTRIPKSAAYAMVRQFDFGKALARVRKALAAGGPNLVAELDKGLATVSEKLGCNVQELSDSLGDQWVIYTDAGVGGVGSEGLVVANELDDEAKANDGLSALSAAIVRLAANQRNMGFVVQAGEMEVAKGLKVHYIDIPQGKPAWVVKDGAFYFAVRPQAVGAAVGVTKLAGGDFADNEKFRALRGRLGVEEISGFEFADLPQTAPRKYGELTQAYAMVGMMAATRGIILPQPLLPRLELIQEHLFPAGSVSWVDDDGWHSRGVSPFPGSALFASQQIDTIGVGVTAMAVSIILPSLNRARETANRVKCASNERQIGQAILLYSNDNRGKYPPDLGTLLKSQGITIDVFVCPSSSDDVPPEVKAGNIHAQAAWVNANASYVYVGAGMKNTAGPETVVLYERDDDHREDGLNFLYGDGHIEWQPMPVARQLIQQPKQQPVQQPQPGGGL